MRWRISIWRATSRRHSRTLASPWRSFSIRRMTRHWATVASAAWLLASSTPWPPSPCRAGVTASVTTMVCSSNTSRMDARWSAPTSGSATLAHGRSPGRTSPTQCVSAVPQRRPATKTGSGVFVTPGARSSRPWPTIIPSQASTLTTPTTCACGALAPPRSSILTPSTRATTRMPSRSDAGLRTSPRCFIPTTTSTRARSCACGSSTSSAVPRSRISSASSSSTLADSGRSFPIRCRSR
mmetsp:Transcript_49259/g.112151  ORF Transcript_49259/g.112151 Transcript_49259/m.112151 type:complete len:239 (-) Transcript_49259:1714-2430(-)